MRILLAFALSLVVTAANAASLPLGGGYGALDAARDIDPLSLGRLFCAARLSGDMSGLERFYAPKLRDVLATHAKVANAGIVPWQSYAEQPTACTVAVDGPDNIIGVLVTVTYSSPEHTWTDTLNLQRTPDSWLLNNVFYGAGGNLLFRLFAGA